MPEKDTYEDLPFPAEGVELIQGFDSQRVGTTPVGNNVRVYEALTQRGRGGSRSGLTQYIPARVGNVSSLIQHLNTIVTVSGSFTGDIPGGTFPDPSDPGPPTSWTPNTTSRIPSPVRLLPFQQYPAAAPPPPVPLPLPIIGGWGWPPNKQPKSGTNPHIIAFVQSATNHTPPMGDTEVQVQYTDSVTAGNLLFAIPGGAASTPTDTLGNTYIPANFDNSIYFAISRASGPNTVTFQYPGGSVFAAVAVAEYSGVDEVSGLDGTSEFEPFPGQPTTDWTTGVIPVSVPQELVIGVFFIGVGDQDLVFVPDSPFTLRASDQAESVPPPVNLQTGLPYDSFLQGIFFVDSLSVSTSTAVTGQGNNVDSWGAVGASFRRALS